METSIAQAFPYETRHGEFPSEAVFRGKYHIYRKSWGCRIWNHYRWVRIVVNQTILELTDRYPVSSMPLISAVWRRHSFDVIKRLAEDTLTSTPSQWRHPVLPDEAARSLEASGQGGSGAVGLPGLLWHLKIAGCAPGVPEELWHWSYNVIQCVWRSMGMSHARLLAEVMDGHRHGKEQETVARLLAEEL